MRRLALIGVLASCYAPDVGGGSDAAAAVDAPAMCESDWTLDEDTGTCKRYVDDRPRTWIEAELDCRSRFQAHLAVAPSRLERDWLSTRATSSQWVGLFRPSAVDPWRWVTGETESMPEWDPGGADGGELCAYLSPQGAAKGGLLGATLSCTFDYEFVYFCERDGEPGIPLPSW